MSEFEPKPRPIIVEPTPYDVESYRRMQAREWVNTYENDAAGVTREWLEQVTNEWLTPEFLDKSRDRVARILEQPDAYLYVAKVGEESVGMVSATTFEGNQRLEALYVDEAYHGTGTAQSLMDTAMAHFDLSRPVELETIVYNERAQRFYRKYGFEIVPGSEHMFKEIMPSIKMTRRGETK